MNLPITSTLMRVRSVWCPIILAGALLSQGCARGPRATLSHVWGRASGVVADATSSESAEAPGRVTANSGVGTDADVEAGDRGESARSILERGKTFAIFSRRSSREDESIENPFETEFANTEEPSDQPGTAVVADFTTTESGGDTRTASASSDEVNPFAEFETTADEQTAPKADETNVAEFDDGFDSQMDRLRALMQEEADASESPKFQPLRAEEIRQEVIEQTKLARTKIQFGELHAALKIATTAQSLADEANLFFGPNEEKPGELVSLIREMLEALQLPVPENEHKPVTRIEEPVVGSESVVSTEQVVVSEPVVTADESENPFENFNEFEAEVACEATSSPDLQESQLESENPFEADFEPHYESSSPDEEVVIAPAEEVHRVQANDQPAPKQELVEDHGFRGVIVPGPLPSRAGGRGRHERVRQTARLSVPRADDAPEVEIVPSKNLVTLGAPSFEETSEGEVTAAALVPAILTVPDTLPEQPAFEQTAALLDSAVAEPPSPQAKLQVPSYVTALDPIDWELEPAPKPDTSFDASRFPRWFGVGLVVIGLLGLGSFRRHRRIARRS